MSRPSRETVLATFLLVLLVGVTFLTTLAESQEQAALPDLASFSNAPSGTRALRLWLEEEGFGIAEADGATFVVPANTSLVLVLEPQAPGITEDEWVILDEWVNAGGTLVALGEGFGAAFSFSHFEVEIDYTQPQDDLAFSAPFLGSPPFAPTGLRARATLRTEREDIVTLLAAGDSPLVVAFAHGAGTVVLGTVTYPLTNAGLKESTNPPFALNLAALAGRSGTIWFDEWHHGQRGDLALIGPAQWLRQTPAGHALIYAAAILFFGLVLSGRRFGRPVPLARPGQRRAPREHIVAVANLSRRAGHRQAVLQQYYLQIKRDLGRRFRVNPILSDDEYAYQLALVRPDLDTEALRHLLARLRSADISEAEMVALAREAATWLEK